MSVFFMPIHQHLPDSLVGTEYELQLRNSQGLRIAVFPWGEENGLMKQLFKDSQGRLWLSSSEGVYRVYADMDYIYDIEIDDAGLIWVGGAGEGDVCGLVPIMACY
ncbi:protein of unknown function,might releated with Sensory box protein [Shewanella benthica]|uniref:Uncharacterized protein n=1 Tax=Shewanella benthica TaxID=43661 RepID=A0A330LY55_9GAMM|nr:hypothetical protein [Shewanella benthica]SQH74882.1 protein of unknown function,might releated with Sensory box protein [Shewanella benthica]